MLGKKIRAIGWQCKFRKFIYPLASILIAIAILITNSARVSSATSGVVDLEIFSDMVDNLESTWEREYESYFGRNFSNRARSANQIAKRLQSVREQTNINPAVIWAAPHENFLQLILVTPEKQFIVKQIRGANRTRLTQRIKEFELGIQDRQSLKYYPPARLIYNWIFKPLESYLEAENIDTLLLCTGSQLRSLPFAALHDGEQFLAEKYSLARIPAFNLTDTSYQSLPQKQVLAMGTSEFEDLPSLPGVAIELETIVPKLWSGLKITDRDFTISNLLNAHQSGEFDIIHLASHSLFNPGKPERSFIQFSDRRLNLTQLADLNLDLPAVDLLVLSACETALGDEDAEYGFAGLAMQAGVKSALASLWLIDDVGTVLLMSNFYQQLQSTPIKSAALRQAQLNLLQGKAIVENEQIIGLNVEVNLPTITAAQQNQDFTHPYYWAGFTIIGNPW
ncbi:MAG: CHAT domain-containing protein [Cyanobacteria bacterium J06600_6]